MSGVSYVDLMQIFIIIVVAIICLGFLNTIIGPKKNPNQPHPIKPIDHTQFSGFVAAPSLWVNGPEKAFFSALLTHLPRGYYPQGKVRLEDIIGVRKGLPYKDTQSLRGRVKSRHIDFLIIDRDGRPVLGIELDGNSHQTKRAIENDHVKTALFAAAGISLRRVRVGDDFNHIIAKIVTELSSS